jgi:hypothetical protein
MKKRNVTGLRGLFDRKPSLAVIGGLIVILVVVGAFSLRASAVDPRVTLRQERASYGGRSAPGLTVARLAAAVDGEVSRTADRVAEATALAFSSGVYLASAGARGGPPRDAQTLVAGLAQTGLLPPGLATTQSAGTFASAWGSLSVRYRPAPLGVEIVSVASKPEYGPALIVRLPDETSDKGEARLYVADRLQGVTAPAPFAPAAEVIALGWSPERLRALK